VLFRSKPTRIARWIWSNGLNLNLCPFCEAESPDAFDLYALSGFEHNARRTERTEQILDMLNAIHRSYSVARWQLLQGAGVAGRPPRDHVVIQRASQDAQHDLKTGMLLTAASGFYSILNQTAAALNAYFGLNHGEFQISLAKVWWPAGSRKRHIPRKRSDLHPRLQRTPFLMLSALHRLAFSFEHGSGRYAPLRTLRNSIEHHVVVVRQEELDTQYYKYVDAPNLENNVIKLGQIAKAALLYLGGSIWMEEFKRLQRRMSHGAAVTPGERWVERK